jgi:hypothetical protein
LINWRRVNKTITVATIREQDQENGRIINIDVNTETGEITANGDECGLGIATSAEDAFKYIYDAWGRWNTIEFVAEYGDGWNIEEV